MLSEGGHKIIRRRFWCLSDSSRALSFRTFDRLDSKPPPPHSNYTAHGPPASIPAIHQTLRSSQVRTLARIVEIILIIIRFNFEIVIGLGIYFADGVSMFSSELMLVECTDKFRRRWVTYSKGTSANTASFPPISPKSVQQLVVFMEVGLIPNFY